MTSLRDALRSEAERRGLWPREGSADSELDASDAFYLIRDMPYGRASSWEPAAILSEWRGTCSGKHYLLKSVLEEMGVRSRVMACTQRVNLGDRVSLPAGL